MIDDDGWHDLRGYCERIEPGAQLRTPLSDRPFRIGATYDDRIVVRFLDGGEERSLEREQFEVLADRLDDGPIDRSTLTPGVEPYAAVLTLSGTYGVDDDRLVGDPDSTGGESPYLVPAAEARTRPERVRDDALLLATLLEDVDVGEPTSLETDDLVDAYVLLSDVQRGADRLRSGAGDALLDRLGPEQTMHGRFGMVRRTTRERRTPKDEETVFDRLDDRGIPREWVLGVDRDKLDVVVAATDVDEDDVFDVDEQVYAQKTGVDESEKYSRLRGIRDRIEELDGAERDELREELDDLEGRLEEALSSG